MEVCGSGSERNLPKMVKKGLVLLMITKAVTSACQDHVGNGCLTYCAFLSITIYYKGNDYFLNNLFNEEIDELCLADNL